jgi:hypothetical protein
MRREVKAIDPFEFARGRTLNRHTGVVAEIKEGRLPSRPVKRDGWEAVTPWLFLSSNPIESSAQSEVELANRRYLKCFCALGLFILTSCVTAPRHQFAEPTNDWQSRSGQLLYRAASTTIIGEVFVRFSESGDFELNFAKGPGITLLILRQDASFADVRGAMAGPGWSGPIDRAPNRLRTWLGLRDRLLRSQNQKAVRYVAGSETFLFRF